MRRKPYRQSPRRTDPAIAPDPGEDSLLDDDDVVAAAAPADPTETQIHQVTLSPPPIGHRFDKALADALPAFSRARLQSLIKSGCVRAVDGKPMTDPSLRLGGDLGDLAVEVAVPPAIAATPEPQAIPLSRCPRRRASDRGRQARRPGRSSCGRQPRRHPGQCPARPLRRLTVRDRRRTPPGDRAPA